MVRQVLELLLLWPQGGRGVGDEGGGGWRGSTRQGKGDVRGVWLLEEEKKMRKKMTGKLLKKENMMASSKIACRGRKESRAVERRKENQGGKDGKGIIDLEVTEMGART